MPVTLGEIGSKLSKLTTPSDRASLKGVEISKLGPQGRERVSFSGFTCDIDIIGLTPIRNGVQVLARVWDESGKQFGFGDNGEVDIERFLIYNPPILVADGVAGKKTDSCGVEIDDVSFVENPKLALQQSIAHTVKVKNLRFDDKNIVAGKVGHTTSTFYPSLDGDVVNQFTSSPGTTWSNLHDAATGTGAGYGDNLFRMQIEAFNISSNWRSIQRMMCLFDTSDLGDTDTISSATFSLYGSSTGGDNFDVSLVIVLSDPASDSAITTADYDAFTFTRQSDTEIAQASINTSGYNNFPLNATGIGNISLTGLTKLGIVYDKDADDTEPTWVGGYAQDRAYFHSSEATGTSNDPKLVVEHSSPSTGIPSGMMMLGVGNGA
jgi:hypothetical protein